jgi:hypothetical protein
MDAAESILQFPARARTVVHFNACGREYEYAKLVAALESPAEEDDEVADDAETLTSILVAKSETYVSGIPVCEWESEVQVVLPPPPYDPDEVQRSLPGLDWINSLDGECGQRSVTVSDSISAGGAEPVTIRKVVVRGSVGRDCMKQQVNRAIRAMKKRSQMGSDGLVCLFGGQKFPKGDFDVAVRELVRLLYMGTYVENEVLEPSTLQHMWDELLVASGPVGVSSYSMVSDCEDPAGSESGTPEERADREDFDKRAVRAIKGFLQSIFDFFARSAVALGAQGLAPVLVPIFIVFEDELVVPPLYDFRIDETENHRLMIESSRFLTNQRIIEQLKRSGHDNVDAIEEQQETVRRWLLLALRKIAFDDFEEYNSRPYTRYSLEAILNLHDFARDNDIRAASKIVLDLSSAKFAATSSMGRRSVPFRRLSDNDGFSPDPGKQGPKNLYNVVSGADHEVVRAFVLYGNSPIWPAVEAGGLASMVNSAVSAYRSPRPAIELAVTRKGPVEESGLYERSYVNEAFTMSVGGRPTAAALNLYGAEREADKGVAMPTVLIPTVAGVDPDVTRRLPGTHYEHLYAFLGSSGVGPNREANFCGYKGFICGNNPQLSSAFRAGETVYFTSDTTVRFVSSNEVVSDANLPHFFLVASGNMMEMVPAPRGTAAEIAAAYDAFRTERLASIFTEMRPLGGDRHVYRSASGELITYRVSSEVSEIVDGVVFGDQFITNSSTVKNVRNIRNPGTGSSVTIDLRDAEHPKVDPAPVTP